MFAGINKTYTYMFELYKYGGNNSCVLFWTSEKEIKQTKWWLSMC